MLRQIRVDKIKLEKGLPCIEVRREDGVERCFNRVEIMGPSTLKFEPNNPGWTGATAYLETKSEVIGLPQGEMI